MTKLSTAVFGLAMSTMAFGAGVPVESEVKESTEVVKVNTGKGFYIGAGVGTSFYNVSLTQSEYSLYDEDGTYTIKGDDLDQLDDSDVGYLFYGGYQFNKIIGVEGSFTDYGTVTGTISNKVFSKKPQSYAVSANAGYNFLNGQLRPFGLLGLGYLATNQNSAYDEMNGWDDGLATVHFGFGVEDYPMVLQGFGVRGSYTADSCVSEVDTREGPSTTDKVVQTLLWQTYSVLYIGAQYKF